MKSIILEDNNQNDKASIKTTHLIRISSIENRETNNNIYLGKKRIAFENSKNKIIKKKKLLSISKPIRYFIKNSNINNNENNNEKCIICLQNISFENNHFLHCGHNFHCNCINHLINNGNTNCPFCRKNIYCPNNFSEEHLLNLEENDNNDNNNDNNNRINRIIDRRNYSLILLIIEKILPHIIVIAGLYYIFIVNFKYSKYFIAIHFIFRFLYYMSSRFSENSRSL